MGLINNYSKKHLSKLWKIQTIPLQKKAITYYQCCQHRWMGHKARHQKIHENALYALQYAKRHLKQCWTVKKKSSLWCRVMHHQSVSRKIHNIKIYFERRFGLSFTMISGSRLPRSSQGFFFFLLLFKHTLFR